MNALWYILFAYILIRFLSIKKNQKHIQLETPQSFDIAREIAKFFDFDVRSLIPSFVINPSINPEEQKKLLYKTNMLVRNADGTVSQKTVPVDIPFEEINEIYGHGIHKYDYKFPLSDTLSCINYPSKRWIDANGSNLILPNYSCNQHKKCHISTKDPLPNDRELFLNDTVTERSVISKYIHPLSKRIVFANHAPYYGNTPKGSIQKIIQ